MNLNQVTLPSINLEKAVSFYRTLGFKLIVDSLPNYVRFELPEGNGTLSLSKVIELPIGDGIHIYFECENLDQIVDELMSKGINFDSKPENQTWLWREAKLRDPDGNVIILYFAGENRLNPPWKVNDIVS